MIKYIMIIVRVILLMVLIPFVWEIIYFKTNLKKEVYILPHGFKGIVLIARPKNTMLMIIATLTINKAGVSLKPSQCFIPTAQIISEAPASNK